MKKSTKKMVLTLVVSGSVGWTVGRVINRAAVIEENTFMKVLLIVTGLITTPVTASVCSPVIVDMVNEVIPEKKETEE